MPATQIFNSVGEGGKNVRADVKVVQALLNNFVAAFGLKTLEVDGYCGRASVAAIRHFQAAILGYLRPDGRIDPGGRTMAALVARADELERKNRLSGRTWWQRNQGLYLNSESTADLEPQFRGKVEAFIKALKAGGARVTVSSTRRNKVRAYLMHYCYRIARGEIDAGDVPMEAGCNILWDHGEETASREAARIMADLFDIVYQPSLTSRHVEGKAVDMSIRWTGTIKVKDAAGRTRSLAQPGHGMNTMLHEIGRSFGVYKLVSDEPHWSSDGK